jgi:hypothetical protein
MNMLGVPKYTVNKDGGVQGYDDADEYDYSS